MYTGPHIIKDNLVFGYDTGYGVADNATGTRFYPGKAVDNEFYNSGPDGTILDYVGYGGTGTAQSGALDAFGTTDNIVYRKTGKLRFGPTGGDDIGTLYYGNTYTFSIYMRHVPGETQMSGGEFDICDRANSKSYSGTLSSNMTYEWKRFSVTALHNNSSNYHFIDVGIYQGTGVFEWCCPQIELGTIASPFTSTERSATASLIDLKETSNIDLSNVSFDSTGQPIWDGTNDRSDVTSHPAIEIVDNVSIEYVYKRLSTDPVLDVIANKYHSTGWELFCTTANKFSLAGRNGDGTYYSTGNGGQTMVNNKFYHLVAQKEGTSWRLYVNGELDSSTTANSVGTWSNTGVLQIGGEGNGYFPNMELPVFKIYNKVLSTSEIKQNFNAYKNRFDI